MEELQHRYSDELLKDYSVFGFFYRIKNQSGEYRSVLEIIRKKVLNQTEPYTINCLPKVNMVAIMMNPGKSKPTNDKDIFSTKGFDVLPSLYKEHSLVPTNPDRTQYQLMRVMDAMPEVDRLRVLNLSDLRQANSGQLSSDMQGKMDSHSLFSEDRNLEREQLLIKKVPVILAFGGHDKLVKFALNAMEAVKENKIVGIGNSENKNYYQHPLRRFYKNRDWVRNIVGQLKK